MGIAKFFVKWLGSIEKGEIKPKKLTQLGRCNLCLWATAGYSNKLTTGGEYYSELKLKMVNKLYANISFCVKLLKSLRYKHRIASSYNKFAITAFSYFMPGVKVILSDSLLFKKKNDIKRELPPTVVRRKHQQLSSFVQLMLSVVIFLKFHQPNLRELYRKCSELYWDFIVIPLFVSTVC